VITTAPTFAQVEQLLWREIRGRHAPPAYPYGGKLTNTKLELADDWFAIGLSTNEPERFQGHHARRLLLVVDEAVVSRRRSSRRPRGS
jgi:phage terminase large subunit